MYSPEIIAEAVVNGLLTCALFAVWGLSASLCIDPYAAIPLLTPAFFGLGYGLQRFVIGPASHGGDYVLLVTLGLSIAIGNALLAVFHSDTRSLAGDAAFDVVEIGPMLISRPRLIGIDVRHVYAVTFGLGCACLAVAACLLMPTFYVNPRVGNAFVLVAFTVVALGGMGSVPGALVGGFGGQFSFGHVTFFGTGAYAAAILQVRFGVNAWAACVLGVLAGAAGWAIGAMAFRARLRGSYFDVLAGGRMIAQGAPRQVVADPAVVEAYLGHGGAARILEGTDA